MASAMIALDKCTKKNGCLQILSGSNQIGRIDHALLESGQVGVDLRRVEEAKKHLDLIYCEMEPGDVLFFHCNTLHRSDKNIKKHLYDRKDSEGFITKMVAWNHPDDSIYGTVARSHKMVDTMEHLLGGEVYHYHSKITAKEPFEGGAWEWHQDYGYWYNNGCLFPHMASAMIALDKCTKKNGCLQVLSGSNNIGRIDHALLESGQVGVDLRRVEEAKKHLDIIYCEMEPGDVLFFHCNTLHRSDKNNSDKRRCRKFYEKTEL